MRPLGFSSRTPIGLDIGANRITAVQLAGSPRKWRVASCASFPRKGAGGPVEGEEVLRLVEVLRRQGFRGSDVVAAVPSEKLIGGMMELPSAEARREWEPAVGAELARILGCDPQSFEMSCWVLPPSPVAKDRNQVLAAACRHADADALLDVLEDGGLNVLALDSHAAAMKRACGPALKGSSGIVGILDVGWSLCQLLVFYRDSVVYQRTLSETGVGRVSEALAKNLHLTPEEVSLLFVEAAPQDGPDRAEAATAGKVESLLRSQFAAVMEDLQSPFLYAMQQYPGAAVERVLLAGQGASAFGLPGILGAALGVETRTIRPADLGALDGAIPDRCDAARLALSVGLSQFFW